MPNKDKYWQCGLKGKNDPTIGCLQLTHLK